MKELNGLKYRYKGLSALLLSCLDYTVIQIELNEVAKKTVSMGTVLPTWLYPSPSTLMPFIVWAGLLMLRLKAPEDEKYRTRFHEWLFLAFFSGMLLVGHSFWESSSFTLITANRACLLLAVFSLVGLTLLMSNLLGLGKYLGGKLVNTRLRLPGLWDRHPFLFPFAVIFLLWLPYAVMKYPGGIDYDSYLQLLEPLGLYPVSNHWPISSSLFFAGCFSMGRAVFGSNNAGLFTAIVCQMLFCAACMAYSLKMMHRLKLSGSLQALTLAVYSLATIFSRYTTSLGKDCLFASALLLCISLLAELLFCEGRVSLAKLLSFSAAALLMSVLRSNGPYILFFLLLALGLAWCLKRSRRQLRALACVAGAYCVCLCYFNLLPVMGVPGASVSEALSLPFMQTARYVKYYPEEVSPEEREIIDAVLDYDRLPELYNEKISDGVKHSYHGDGESLLKYFGVWFRQGLRHPDLYFSATFNNVLGYFYPGAKENAMGIYMQYDPVNEDVVQLFSLPEEQAQRRAELLDGLTQFIEAFENFPLFYPVCNVAVQVWLLLFMAWRALIRKRGGMLILLVPSLVGLLICIAGPTFSHNGLRYALPIIFANPLLCSLSLEYPPNKQKN